jgi:hypothetical protein
MDIFNSFFNYMYVWAGLMLKSEADLRGRGQFSGCLEESISKRILYIFRIVFFINNGLPFRRHFQEQQNY